MEGDRAIEETDPCFDASTLLTVLFESIVCGGIGGF